MLEVGNSGLTAGESQAHMSLWSILNAPLIAGNDLRTMPATTKAQLTDPDVVAVNQDWAGQQGKKIRDDGDVEVWSKKLSDGSAAVVLLNRFAEPRDDQYYGCRARPGRSFRLHREEPVVERSAGFGGTIRAQVASHEAAMFKVTPGAPADLAPMVVVEAAPVKPYVTTAGRTDVQVKVNNDGPAALTSAQLSLSTPSAWSATPAVRRSCPTSRPGQPAW